MWVHKFRFELLFKFSVASFLTLLHHKRFTPACLLLKFDGVWILTLLLPDLIDFGQAFRDLGLSHLFFEDFHISLCDNFAHGFETALFLLLCVD